MCICALRIADLRFARALEEFGRVPGVCVRMVGDLDATI